MNRKWVIGLGALAVFGFVAMGAAALVGLAGSPIAGLLATLVVIFGLILVGLVKRFLPPPAKQGGDRRPRLFRSMKR